MSKANLIDRQAAIEAVVAWTVEDRPDIEMPTDLVGRIESLPSAQPEPQWIPCSERLPEEKGYYWTVHSYMSGHIGYNVSRFAKDLYKVDEYDFAEWKGVPGFYTVDEEYGYIKNEVIAWMPIEPWRGEEHDDC